MLTFGMCAYLFAGACIVLLYIMQQTPKVSSITLGLIALVCGAVMNFSANRMFDLLVEAIRAGQ